MSKLDTILVAGLAVCIVGGIYAKHLDSMIEVRVGQEIERRVAQYAAGTEFQQKVEALADERVTAFFKSDDGRLAILREAEAVLMNPNDPRFEALVQRLAEATFAKKAGTVANTGGVADVAMSLPAAPADGDAEEVVSTPPRARVVSAKGTTASKSALPKGAKVALAAIESASRAVAEPLVVPSRDDFAEADAAAKPKRTVFNPDDPARREEELGDEYPFGRGHELPTAKTFGKDELFYPAKLAADTSAAKNTPSAQRRARVIITPDALLWNNLSGGYQYRIEVDGVKIALRKVGDEHFVAVDGGAERAELTLTPERTPNIFRYAFVVASVQGSEKFSEEGFVSTLLAGISPTATDDLKE